MPTVNPCARSAVARATFVALFSTVSITRFALADALPQLDVTKLGVVSDGTTLNTAALQKVIDQTSRDKGGVLLFPPGRYLTGTLQLRDNITLRLAKDATLLGSPDPTQYRNLDPFMAGDGYPLGHALLVAVDAKNVTIEGEGTIDGQGKELHAAQPVAMRERVRPFLLRWIRCSKVAMRGVQLKNAGAWCLHFFQSQDVLLEQLKIRNRGLFNNDGIDIDSSHHVTVRDCDIESGDDAICLKTTSPLPTHHVTVEGCNLSTHCNAIKFGTESIGDYHDVTISNCKLRQIGMAGLALYSVDGAHTERVNLSDITMDGVSVPISIRLGSRRKVFRETTPPTKPRETGVLRNVSISRVTAKGARLIGLLINGIPGHPVEALTLNSVKIEVTGGGSREDATIQLPEKESAYPEFSMFGNRMPAYGAYIRHVRGLQLKDVAFVPAVPDARPDMVRVDVEEATP